MGEPRCVSCHPPFFVLFRPRDCILKLPDMVFNNTQLSENTEIVQVVWEQQIK